MMSITFTMYAPNGNAGEQFTARSGNSYISDAYGFVKAVAAIDVNDLENSGCLSLGISQARSNLTATTDPGVSNDTTQDYQPGSVWLNLTTSRVWMCLSNTTGAATWAIDGVIPGIGIEPSNMLTQFGSCAFGAANGYFTEEGNVYRAESLAGVGNAADTTDDILFGIALPANAFDQAGRGLNITAFGQTGSTTNNKRAKIFFGCTFTGGTLTNGVQVGGTASGGTVIADTGAWVNGTTANNNVGWNLFTSIYKVGAVASNTQIAQGQSILGTTHGGCTSVLKPTVTENAIINIAITGSSYTTGAASDVLCNSFAINAMN
jgi:hypothetical protein